MKVLIPFLLASSALAFALPMSPRSALGKIAGRPQLAPPAAADALAVDAGVSPISPSSEKAMKVRGGAIDVPLLLYFAFW